MENEKQNMSAKKGSLNVQKIPKDAFYATGKRKCAIAKVWLFAGKGQVNINGLDFKEYLKRDYLAQHINEVLKELNLLDKYDVVAKALGGGISGQAEAIRLGLAKAVVSMDDNFKKPLREKGMLTRDSRIKERKKYGRRGARKRPQYRKR